MNKIYETSYTLRAADFGAWSRLRPSSILDLFQDVAGRHANELGVGFVPMMEKNIVWVIVKVRFRVLKEAQMYQNVHVRTWPLPPERIGYQREYVIADENGESIVEGSSEWVLMDFASRKIVAGGNVYPLTEHCTDKVFEDKFPRLRAFEAEGEGYSCLPPFSDFDMNGHVNNTKYANYVLDAISPAKDQVIRTFQMDYHREVLPGEKLTILTRREGDSLLARGENSAGEKMFSCRIEFESE